MTAAGLAVAPGTDDAPGEHRVRTDLVGLWWLSPPGAVLLIVPVTLGLAVALSPVDFLDYFRTPKTLTSSTATLFAAGAGVLVLGALLTQVGRRPTVRGGSWPWLDTRQLALLHRASTVLFRVTMVGYASFVLSALRNGVRPADVVAAFLQQDVSSGDLESRIGTVPGITTLTQVGVAYVVVAALLLLHGRDRRTLLRLAALLLVTVVRAFLLTERLALVEMVVPALAVLAARASRTTSSRRRFLLRVAPLPLVVLLIAGFAATEYSRSYTFFKTQSDDGLLVFSVKRLGGYYATAYNNGQVLLDHGDYPGRLPYTSLEAVWTAPGVEQVDLYDRLTGRDRELAYDRLLTTYASPEFNNPGGLPAPFVDFGPAGGLVLLFGIGVATGVGYRAFAAGRPAGLLLYPVAVTGLLELPRFLYWTLGRTVPTVLALLLVISALHRLDRRRPALTP